MTTQPLAQAKLAPVLAAAIDAVRDATTPARWTVRSRELVAIVEINGRDRCLTPFVRNQIGLRAEWLERYLAHRPIR